MREYGQVQCAFWQSDDFAAMNEWETILALYLLSSPHSNGIGCYFLPDLYVMSDLRWPQERVTEAMRGLGELGYVQRHGNIVFLPAFLRWNPIANPNVCVARVAEVRALPKGPAKTGVAKAFLQFGKHLSEPLRKELETVAETCSEPVPNITLPNPNPYPDPKSPSAGRGVSTERKAGVGA